MNDLPNPPLDNKHVPHRRPTRWKRVFARTIAAIALFFLLVGASIFSLLHSTRFHRYILRTAQAKATTALGSQVHVRDFAVRWSGISPTVELYDVAVQGSDENRDSTLLQVGHIEAEVQVTSLLRRTWYLNNIAIDHPLAHLLVDKNGDNNLPKPKSSVEKSSTDIFDLGIRHVRLSNGEVYFNGQKSILDADLRDLSFQSAFDTFQQSYSGLLGYRDGHLQFGTYKPAPHNFQANFTATRQQFALKHALLTVGASQIKIDATATDYTNPKVDARYEATVDTGQLRSILKNPSLPAGVLHTRGTAQYVSEPNRQPIETAIITGEVSSPSLSVRTPDAHAAIRNLSARYSLANGNVEVHDIRAVILAGELVGALTVRNLAGATRSHLQASVQGANLAELRSMMNSQVIQQVALGGSINATADATWGKNLNDLVARSDATLQGQVSSSNGNGRPVAVDGVIHAEYLGAAKQITLTQSYVRSPQTTLDMNGSVSKLSSLAIRLQSRDLRELEALSLMFETPAPGKPLQPLGLFGTATFNGTVSGSTTAPHIVGQLVANNLQIKGSSWRVIRANVDASPAEARLSNGVLQPADRGQINFSLNAGLDNWSFTPDSPVSATLNGSQINVADLTRAVGVQTPVQGTLNANVSLHGTQLNPIGEGTVSLTQAKLANQPVNNVTLKFQGTGDRVLANLAIRLTAGTANADVTFFPKQRAYEGQLRADGIHLEQLEIVKERNMQMSGVLNLNANGRGTLDNPQLQLTAQVPELIIRDQKASDLNLHATVADHVANINLDSSVINTAVRGQGTVNLTGDYYASATLDTQVIPLGPLVDVYVPAQAGNVSGQTELHATLKGPLKNKNALDAHIIVPNLTVNYRDQIQLGAVGPIRADFTNGVLQLQRAEIRGTGTDLQIQGTFPVGSNAPASLLLLGTVDLKLAQLYDPTITSSGELRFHVNSYGQTSDPNVRGRIDVVNASFVTADLPLGLQNGNGFLTLTKDRLDITQFRGVIGSGTLEASGGIVYRPALQFDIGLRGSGVRVLMPQGIRAGADTQLALTGNLQSALLSGQVRVDQVSFTPNFDLVDFAGQLSAESTAPPSQGFSQALQLNVGLQSTSNVNLVSRTLSVQGTANLTLRGTAAQPVILGRINLSGGDLIFSANRYVLEGGTIEFANPARTDPVVNLNLNTTIDQYNIAMQFWGPVDHLHTTYTSDPALPPSDIINLIAFGKTSEASAANPSPPGSFGAESLIASQVSNQLTSRVEKIAGISQLSIDPILGGSGQSPGARIAVQQRVTSKLFVTFATDVTSTQRETISLQYQATPRVSFSGTRDQNGGFGFDTRIRKTW